MIKHGHMIGFKKSPTYRTWQNMKRRAIHGEPSYRVKPDMDPRWLDFRMFLSDMGERPELSLTLERSDNNRGYWPDNCIWASRKTQSRNRSGVKLDWPSVCAMRQLRLSGFKFREIGWFFDICPGYASKIITDNRWKE